METYAEFSDGITELAENAMKTLGPIELSRLADTLRAKAVDLDNEADEQDESDEDEDLDDGECEFCGDEDCSGECQDEDDDDDGEDDGSEPDLDDDKG